MESFRDSYDSGSSHGSSSYSGTSEGEGSSSEISHASSVTSLGVNPFGFEARTSYDASNDLLNTRSSQFKLKPAPKDDDIWKRPPPDFRPQRYAAKPPKRNSREAMQPWKYGTIPGQREYAKRPKLTVLPHILHHKAQEEGKFQSRFHVLDPYEARVRYVKEGMFPPGHYDNPKPHDFRQYPPIKSLGLDEFVTSHDKDPYNIHFNSKRLRILWDLQGYNAFRDVSGEQMCPPLKLPPKWESERTLPKDRYPNIDNSYTRYRQRVRTPHTGLMDRIEETLMKQWNEEKTGKITSTDPNTTLPRLAQSSSF